MDADYIRDYLRDHKELNISLDNHEQFDDDFLDLTIQMTISEVGISHPTINIKDVPDSTLIFGVISRMMLSETFKELRDQVEYQDANSAVNLNGKESNYERKAILMKNFFTEQLNGIAARKFLHGCWGVTSSNSRELSVDIGLGGNCGSRY